LSNVRRTVHAFSKAEGQDTAFEVFFDGECPLCVREMALLRQRDRAGRIRFTDISRPEFDAAALGVDRATLMKRIHGRLPTGELVEGVEVFRRLYAAVGFARLVRATRLPGVAGLLELAYGVFARNRLRLTGRCQDGACEVPLAS
jgi:predicted DCC family thiol-disulfide oxidoreductase YuxK